MVHYVCLLFTTLFMQREKHPPQSTVACQKSSASMSSAARSRVHFPRLLLRDLLLFSAAAVEKERFPLSADNRIFGQEQFRPK